ncbi:MAG: hypothetical protein RBS53_03205 [Bacteroidales bacterium]|jgi:TM2 domain-containing membrane protein YozV|nr:hypothetical protein [Bacteroidales bacterium]NLM92426.1 hypothetical protein [Bacteroidales bacterium]
MRRTCLISLALLLALSLPAQPTASRELDFARYLMARNELSESLFVLEKLDAPSPALQDSIRFYKGWILYQQKQLEPSAAFLLEVTTESPLFERSRFFASYNLAHIGDRTRADSILQGLSFAPGSLQDALLNFEQGAMALLGRDFEAFDAHAARFSGAFNPFALQEKSLVELAEKLKDHPNHSPFLAGALSTLVPGLGKIYAGKTAEGIASFLYIGAMALTSYDFYRRLGPQNGFFILSAATTGIFYAGNIWGSAVAVNRHKNEYKHEMDQRILFDMHIPLRNIFQ